MSDSPGLRIYGTRIGRSTIFLSKWWEANNWEVLIACSSILKSSSVVAAQNLTYNMTESENNLGAYRHFLGNFLSRKYQFVFFDEQSETSGEIILRHDVDFDTGLALEAAKMEAEMGIKATYFFLLRSNLYNLLGDPAFPLSP